MLNTRQICLVLVVVCALCSTAAAQDSTIAKTTLTITANATGERVRITAPSSVVQMHVEVYAPSGEKLFDQEIRGGNVFDWHLQDGQAQRLAAGAYVCVVTAKSVSGKITQKLGTVTVAEKSASVQSGSPQLSLQQTQAIGPVEADSSWTIAGENEYQTPTVIANDGADGQMIRGRGALTFRVGNFFSGVDQEQMRLTETGDLGIGTSQPQSKLEVAGTIRAERFLVVKPNLGNGDKTAVATQATDAVDGVQPLVAGTGTQNQIAKWTDNAGTLGDSVITETPAGKVGVGIVSPLSKFHVSSNFDALRLTSTNDTTPVWAQFNTSLGTGLGYFGVEGNTPGIFLTGTLPYATALSSGGSGTALQLGSAGSVKMTILSGGNVGIGTTTPAEKLTVQTAKGFYGFTHLATDPNGANPIAISTYVGGSASGATGGWLGTQTNHDLHFFTNGGQPSMTIIASGNVGIGTSTPTNKLHVENTGSGSVAVYGNVTNSGTGVWGNNTNNGTGVYGSSGNGIGILGESNGFAVRGKSTNGYAGYFEGKVYVGGPLEVFGNICAANFMCQSDARLKQAVAELHYGLREVLRLRPVRWDWKDQAQRQLNLGLIAQEVEEVLPELVLHGTDAKDSLGLNYLGLIPVLVKSIQEQQEQIDALRKTNEALNARLQSIERALKNNRGSTRQRR